MLQDWRQKSALQRFADDLQQREQNLQTKMAEREHRITATLGETYKANGKSDGYLLRHFFAEFTSVCQTYFFPNLLQASSSDKPNSPDTENFAE